MLFNSLEFLAFLPAVLLGFYLLPHAARWAWMLAASYWFYGSWSVMWAGLLLATTTVDYCAARRIEAAASPGARRGWLGVSLAANLGLLLTFKYGDFALDTMNHLTGSNWSLLRLALPAGLSFYTFQEIGYVVDVYRGKLPAERHWGKFALFVAYFPQLVAGPISRAGSLLGQLQQRAALSYANFAEGGKFILWGLFQKVVVADNLARVVDGIYAEPGRYSGAWLLAATYAFAFQIYGDFAGYSNIAIGVSRLFGVRLMENFRLPYFACGIREFWSRWHISLSTWFRDYVYIPLGGNRVAPWRAQLNLFLVFAVSGLWHGANWTFVVWGGLHGALLAGENLLSRLPAAAAWLGSGARGWRRLPMAVATFHLALAGWVFFRADSCVAALETLGRIASWAPQAQAPPPEMIALHPVSMWYRLILAALLLSLDAPLRALLQRERSWPRWLQYAFFGLVAACSLYFGFWGHAQFLYFQF